jgi:hypothetical protein
MMQANGSRMKKYRPLSEKISKLTIILLVLILPASLFATMYLPKLGVSYAEAVHGAALSTGSNEPEYTMQGWNVTTIGATEASDIGNNGVIFNGNFVFWRTVGSTDFALTAFNLSTQIFKDVWNFHGGDSNLGYYGNFHGGDLKVINNTIFASFGRMTPYNTTIIDSSNLNAWSVYCTSSTQCAESLCQYTGIGPFSGMIFYGGCNGDTTASICAWNSSSNTEIHVFEGTYFGSDDCFFLTMPNSTCMVGGDAYPVNMIYTNDGGNWTDECSPDSNPWNNATYPFAWASSVYVSGGTAYAAAQAGLSGYYLYPGGLETWSGPGTTQAFNYNMAMTSISNGLMGGTAGTWGAGASFSYPAVIYQYNSDGTLGSLIWSSGDYGYGEVNDLGYASSSLWYAIFYDGSTATILKITTNIIA